jgi:type IV secretion system protein VirD4
MAGRTISGEDIAILRPEEIRRLQERRALVIAENGKPIIARLSRYIDGRKGAELFAGQAGLRAQLADRHSAAMSRSRSAGCGGYPPTPWSRLAAQALSLGRRRTAQRKN